MPQIPLGTELFVDYQSNYFLDILGLQSLPGDSGEETLLSCWLNIGEKLLRDLLSALTNIAVGDFTSNIFP